MQYLLDAIEHEKRRDNHSIAISYLQIALAKYPKNEQLLYAAGLFYADLGYFNSAIQYYNELLQINPQHKDALFDISAVLFHSGKWRDAIEISDTLVLIDPSYRNICMHTGNALSMMGKWKEAIERYKKHISLNKENPLAWSDMLLSMNYVQLHQKDRFSVYKELWDSIEPPPSPPVPPINNTINVGYVSSDFRNHAVAYFTKGALTLHNPEKVIPYFYHNSFVEDHITQIFKQSKNYRNIASLSDELVIEQLKQDRIHILVDLNGHTRDNRLSLFLKRPVSIQISWLGFLNTLGIPQIKHKITHAGMVDEEQQQFYTEKLHRLNNGLFYSPPEDCPQILPQPFHTNGYITYGCLNNPRKITDATIQVWDRILTENSTARLKLLSSGEWDEELSRKFSEENRNKLMFEKECSTLDFMVLLSSIDVCLDPFPHSGGATTGHSLWMGVPVVTLRGKSEFENISSALLQQVNLQHFICKSIEDYVYCASTINIDELVNIREKVRTRFPTSPHDLIQELEELYVELITEQKINLEM